MGVQWFKLDAVCGIEHLATLSSLYDYLLRLGKCALDRGNTGIESLKIHYIIFRTLLLLCICGSNGEPSACS